MKLTEEQQDAWSEYLDFKELYTALNDAGHLMYSQEARNLRRELKAYILDNMHSLYKIHKVEG